MKLPWKNDELKQKIDSLETTINKRDEKIGKLENMLEAEKDRRKKHTKAKQEAQERVNRLEDKIEGLTEGENESDSHTDLIQDSDLSLKKFKDSLEKIDSIESSRDDLVTVYSPGKLSSHSSIQEIKNSIPEEKLRPLMNSENLLIFYDPDLGLTGFKSQPFYEEKFVISNEFEVDELQAFFSDRKAWVLVSRGDTEIFVEEDGIVDKVEGLKSRVNRKHGKGGFSQGRFERKRDEQIDQHLEEVKKSLKNRDNIYLLGEKSLCKELPGKRIGGFDPNQAPLTNFYRPRRLKISAN